MPIRISRGLLCGRLQRSRAIKEGKTEPFCVGLGHLHPSEAPPRLVEGVAVGAPELRQDAGNRGSCPVEPSGVEAACGIDLGAGESWVTQLFDTLLAVVVEQPAKTIYVGGQNGVVVLASA